MPRRGKSLFFNQLLSVCWIICFFVERMKRQREEDGENRRLVGSVFISITSPSQSKFWLIFFLVSIERVQQLCSCFIFLLQAWREWLSNQAALGRTTAGYAKLKDDQNNSIPERNKKGWNILKITLQSLLKVLYVCLYHSLRSLWTHLCLSVFVITETRSDEDAAEQHTSLLQDNYRDESLSNTRYEHHLTVNV